MPRHVDVYFSVVSPWAHLGHPRFLEIAKTHGLEVGWKPLQLPSLFAETGGLPLAKRSAQRRRYRDVEVIRWAERLGRPLKIRPAYWPFDPSLADRCVIAIADQGDDPAGFAGDAMRGAWEEDRDLAARDVVAEVLANAGFDAEAVIARAEGDGPKSTYAANQIEGQEVGVFGSPTYVLDGEAFWGQDRLDLLDEALTSGRPPTRPPEG